MSSTLFDPKVQYVTFVIKKDNFSFQNSSEEEFEMQFTTLKVKLQRLDINKY